MLGLDPHQDALAAYLGHESLLAQHLQASELLCGPASSIQCYSFLQCMVKHCMAVQVNRTDVLTLGGTFQTAAGIMQAGLDDLIACPGIGPTKIRR